MMRRAFTLIEIIITVAITGILSVGMFKAFEAITLRSEKAKILATLSIDSQTALDQISILLYNRAPISVVGFNETDLRPYSPLSETVDKKIIEWYGLASESYLANNYSGFVDMNASSKPTLSSPNTDLAAVLATQQDKWGSSFTLSDMVLIFSGSFDEGIRNDYNITASAVNTITLSGTLPDVIYEKYNLVDSAYAVTRKEDASSCAKTSAYNNDTLLLFYNYRPWKNQSFCDGNVSVLATNVNAFRAQTINGTIRLAIDTNRTVRGGNPVRLSKQKVVF